jgi:hypothetical protein
MANKDLVLKVNDEDITVTKIDGEDYISLGGMAKAYGEQLVIENWLRNKNTIEFLGIWEQLNNSNFNSLEFEVIRNRAGVNRFVMSVKQWITSTNAKGIIAKTGRYGGTYAHRDIAFEFGTWLSPEFRLLLIAEFQRLKKNEQTELEWNVNRYLSKLNYKLHTDAIKRDLLPVLSIDKLKERFIYADEADVLNLIIFGQTHQEWRELNPELAINKCNQRDYASHRQLLMLANIEYLNSHLISQGIPKQERYEQMLNAAKRQYEVLVEMETKQIEDSYK